VNSNKWKSLFVYTSKIIKGGLIAFLSWFKSNVSVLLFSQHHGHKALTQYHKMAGGCAIAYDFTVQLSRLPKSLTNIGRI
jgi:hypothetical protein